MVALNLGAEYGYVILAASGSWLINFWQSMKIGGKRKELGVKVRLLNKLLKYIIVLSSSTLFSVS